MGWDGGRLRGNAPLIWGVVLGCVAVACPREGPPEKFVPTPIDPPEPYDAGPPPVQYPGPMGLTWGMTEADVKKAVKGQLNVIHGAEEAPGLYEETFSGPFEGLPTQMISMTFCHDALATMAVVFDTEDKRPIRARWKNELDRMREKFGPPTQLREVPPPASAEHARMGEAEAEEADERAIEARRDGMSAVWEFPHEISVTVDVVGSKTGSTDGPQLFLDWTAMNTPLAKSCPGHRAR